MGWKCERPEVIRQAGSGNRMVIPCGYCLGCTAKWRKGWVLRMILEAQSSAHASFLTLTYSENCVPTRLEYADISSFWKRLRKNFRMPVRFFCVGEYGEQTGRPHWHAIVYTESPIMPLGLNYIQEWQSGGIICANAEPASMAYVAGYTLKKRYQEMEVQMSRRPGLGLERGSELGQIMARQMPEVEYFPTAIRSGKQLYPLHRKLREVMQESYQMNGGSIRRVGRHPFSMEVESAALVMAGNYRASDRRNVLAIERMIIRETERVEPQTPQKPAGSPLSRASSQAGMDYNGEKT